MKAWNIFNKIKTPRSEFKTEQLIEILLENRGIKTKKEKENFLNPKLEDVDSQTVGLDPKELKIALTRIKKALDEKQEIIIFGDYDVDGITGAAILWETLNKVGAKVLPYIPHRVDEGYGLSVRGIDNIKDQSIRDIRLSSVEAQAQDTKSKLKDVSLIITVDNGIVAHDAVEYANKQGVDVIITDHHVPDDIMPKAHSIIHTTSLCGAGVAYIFSQEIKFRLFGIKDNDEEDIHLELATLGTIADMVPLTGPNRTLVKHGLLQLGKRRRLGLQALFKLANLAKEMFTVYDVGYIIAPRLNAAGRIESAMDSLRLLCTKDDNRARMLAAKLEEVNTKRQNVLKKASENAIEKIKNQKSKTKNLLFVADKDYPQGVIGLVAGKLVEEFYRPAIVVSIGEKVSKASARSISGFNLIEFLRLHTREFINVGGHPMAAGFSVETKKLSKLQNLLEKEADKLITKQMLLRSLKVDCELSLSVINMQLYNELQILAPFGMGNPEPTFVSYNVEIKDMKLLGKEKNHLKMQLKQNDSQTFDGIAFGMGKFADNLKAGNKIDIAYIIDNNVWNGNSRLQLKIKDIKLNE